MRVRTMNGVVLDIAHLMAQNEEVVAVGNANMNARGDILGAGGKIVKRREQIAQEYHQNNPKAPRKVSLKDAEPDTFMTPAQAVETAMAYGKELKEQGKKKIIDSDK